MWRTIADVPAHSYVGVYIRTAVIEVSITLFLLNEARVLDEEMQWIKDQTLS